MKQWGIRKDLYWCPNCNIPLRVERCHKCGGKAIRLRITEPGDARPAFNGDREFMREAFKNEFNDEKLMSELGIDNEIVLLNRTPHYDDMKEVIVGGVIVGRLYFDPYLLKWRWRLSKFSAIKAAERGLIKVFRTDKVKPLEVVGTGQGIEGEQALVTDRSGNPKALAILRRGRFRIQLIFKDKTLREPFKAKAGIKDVIKGNEEYLRTLVSRSIAHIAIISSKVGLPVLLSYSGGKDSLLSLHLTLNA
ncbi:MAG TPA: hypothetical protein ENF75_07040, partial [Acidilobales archaeon]|nr:hypothetical protein [Acidilobales archaeon]